jgi:hypothetical protein
MAQRDAIEVWTAGGADETVETAWAGGLLAPGAAIAVPRRLLIEDGLSQEDVAAWRARAEGASISFDVLPDPEVLREARGGEDPLIAHNARAITLRSGQVRIADVSDGIRRRLEVPYVIGPSAETLAVRINDVEFTLREDTGAILAILAGFGVGSCPFVYASRPGQDVMLNRGTIIPDQIGAASEARHRRYLGRAVGRIEVRELESEISHLNQLRLIVLDGEGRERSYAPAHPRLRDVDEAYVRLSRDDVLALDFPGYAPREDDRAVYLETVGYYVPLPGLARDHVAILSGEHSALRR